MKRRLRMLVCMTLMGVMLFSAVAYAASKTGTYYNGDVALTCTISCTSSSGGSKTKGAPYGKRQTANIIIYNSSNVAVGSGTDNKPYTTEASASASGSKAVRAVSGHYITNQQMTPEYPLYQQVQLSLTP